MVPSLKPGALICSSACILVSNHIYNRFLSTFMIFLKWEMRVLGHYKDMSVSVWLRTAGRLSSSNREVNRLVYTVWSDSVLTVILKREDHTSI